jgi:hypothetical protein
MMATPISEYHVFTFESLAKAQEAHSRIVRFITTRSGAAFLLDPKRAVILSGPPTTLYLSPGAFKAGRTLWIDFPTGKVIKGVELPKGLSLIYGESLDVPL